MLFPFAFRTFPFLFKKEKEKGIEGKAFMRREHYDFIDNKCKSMDADKLLP